jgi:hypothetical protein
VTCTKDSVVATGANCTANRTVTPGCGDGAAATAWTVAQARGTSAAPAAAEAVSRCSRELKVGSSRFAGSTSGIHSVAFTEPTTLTCGAPEKTCENAHPSRDA